MFQQLAIRGDGYQHNHKDAAHLFPNKEEFKGVSVITAVDVCFYSAIELPITLTFRVATTPGNT